MAARPATCNINVVSSDTLIRTGPGYVYWIVTSSGATGGLFQLNDSLDDSGTDKLSGDLKANTSSNMLQFDPPIHFDTGIWVDVPGTNLILNVGWSV